MITLVAAAFAFQGLNTLSPKEVKDGWQLLFDGKTTKGWHNFKAQGVAPGWTVEDGILKCSDPGHAGDIVSDEKFEWFELQLDWNVSKMGNSGIMFHVADDGDATWFSGPEIQIMDKAVDPHGQLAGYLYELYPSKVDSTNPPGEWNHFRIVVSPKKCMTFVNNVKYYEYVLNSDDFKARVAKSKFANMPNFAKLNSGSIAIQGDHGVVSFRNIKIKRLKK